MNFQRRTRVLLILIFYSLSILGWSKVRDRVNPLDPSSPNYAVPCPPVTQVLWRNGIKANEFMCHAWYYTSEFSPVSATDNVNGDTTALQASVVASAYSSAYFFMTGSPYPDYVDTTAMIASGHLQFDIRLEQPLSSFVELKVVDNQTSNSISLLPMGLTTSSFTHVSIPLNSLYLPNPYKCPYCENEALALSMQTTTSLTGPLVTINDVEWTAN